MAQIELQHAFGRIDPISGLPNRNQFIEDLEDLARDRRNEQRAAVLIDLVGPIQLTSAVSALGPSFLDDLVASATRGLRDVVGHGTALYQITPTQIAFVQTGGDNEVMRLSAEQVRGRLRTVARPGAPVSVNPTLGIAPFTLGETLPQDVLRTAHGAMQDARDAEAGVGFYSPVGDDAHRLRFKILSDFPAALAADDQLFLEYQPRVDVRTGACVGAEALLRWRHPTLGRIAPGDFIPVIEPTILMRDATRWVVKTALARLADWQARGLDLTVSVNVSASNLEEPDFASHLADSAALAGVPPERLEIELTESALIRHGRLATEQIDQICAGGFRLAIDDFGTGYSSLSYLERIPASVVKIDRSFMRGFGGAERDRTPVEAMVSLIHKLGYRVVAEGVETQDVHDALERLGCDEIQGYLFSPWRSDGVRVEWHVRRGLSADSAESYAYAVERVVLSICVGSPGPSAAVISTSVARSVSLTATPPKPRKPPSFPASAARCATVCSHFLNPAASWGALPSSREETARSSSIARGLRSDSRAPSNRACIASRAAVRTSAFVRSSATAFASGFAPASCLTSSRAQPPDMLSFSRPQSPLGSAAVIAMLATFGLATMRAHSPPVKFALAVIASSSVATSMVALTPGSLNRTHANLCRWKQIGRRELQIVRHYPGATC
jgi:EAL domain-containing protein (putative c-di-GMP-specific phosphodiesterase class I)